MNRIVADFLTRCCAPGDTIAILLGRKSPLSTKQRIVALERALSRRYLGWLAHENAAGANIYVAANPLRRGSRKRTKESIAELRHLYIDIDSDEEVRVAALRASDAVPPPTTILSTPRNKYQVLWRVEGFDCEVQERTLKQLAIAFGGDPACTDCNRVLRLPGFLNCNYDPAYPVTVNYPCDSTWNPRDFRLNITASDATLSVQANAARKHPGKHTNSERDWAWILHEIALGKDPLKLTRELALRRSDKPHPVYYAQRTVDVASATRWLTEGIGMDDVITILEVRRRFEMPSSLCSTRAREIATTAQRMIARKKIA